MKKKDLPSLVEAIREAMLLAEKVAKETPDQGSCNLDRVMLHLTPRWKAPLEAEGIKTFELGNALALSASWGMANSNTKACQAAAKHLTDKGFSAYVWYQID